MSYDLYFGNQEDDELDVPREEESIYSSDDDYALYFDAGTQEEEEETVVEEVVEEEESLSETKPITEDISFEDAVAREEVPEEVSELPSFEDAAPTIAPVEMAEGISPARPEDGMAIVQEDLGAALDFGRDTLLAAGQGAISLPQAFVGLVDIPLGGRIGILLEQAGYRPSEAKDILESLKSGTYKESMGEFEEAVGFGDSLAAIAKNPQLATDAIVQSLPQMLGGQAIAKGLLKVAPKLAPYIAGAIGEGALGAGMGHEAFRAEQKGELTTMKQRFGSLAIGVGTAAVGVAGGKFAAKMGFDDIDDFLLAKAPGASKASVYSRILAGTTTEALEELTQESQSTVWTNAANGDPLTQGLDKAAAMSLVSGGTMGALVQMRPKTASTLDAAPTQADADNILREAGIANREGEIVFDDDHIDTRIDTYNDLASDWDAQVQDSEGYKQRTNDPDVVAARKAFEDRAREFRAADVAYQEAPVELPPKTQERYEEKRVQEQAEVDKARSAEGQKLVDKLKAQGVSSKSAEESASVFIEAGKPATPKSAEESAEVWEALPGVAPKLTYGSVKLNAASDFLEKQEKFAKENKNAWAVDTVTQKEVVQAMDEDRLVEVGGGRAIVTEDGNMIGAFKFDPKAKGVAGKLIKKAVAKGGIKLDNFDGPLTKLYEKEGFRVVSRVAFNEAEAPADMPASERAKKPDVVFMVYDPKNELEIEEKSFGPDGYMDGMSHRDNLPIVRDKSETIQLDKEISNLQESMKDDGYSDTKATQLGRLLRTRDRRQGVSPAPQATFDKKPSPSIPSKVTKGEGRNTWVHEASGKEVTKIGEGKFTYDGTTEVFKSVSAAMVNLNKEKGAIRAPKKEGVGFTADKKAVITTESAETTLEKRERAKDKVTPIRPVKTVPKTISKKRRIVTKKGEKTVPLTDQLSITISPEEQTLRQEKLVGAILSEDQQRISTVLGSYPQGDRKAVLRSAIDQAKKQVKVTGDYDIDTVTETAGEALDSVAGKKLLVGNFEMEPTELPGVYIGKNPDTGSTWKIFKTGKGEFTIMQDKKAVDVIEGNREAALKVVKEGVAAESKFKQADLKGDPRLDYATYHFVVLDKNGDIVPGPDRQGFKRKKEAVAYASTLAQGKEVVAKPQAAKQEAAEESEKKQRQIRDKAETIQPVKDVKKTKKLEKEIMERQAQARKEEAGAREMRQHLKDISADKRKALLDQYNETVEDFGGFATKETTALIAEVVTSSEALDQAIASDDKDAKAVGQLIKSVIGDKLDSVDFVPAFLSASPDKKGSWYDITNGIIYYQPGVSPRTVVHEVIHAITVDAIRGLPAGHPLKLRMNKAFAAVWENVTDTGLLSEEEIASLVDVPGESKAQKTARQKKARKGLPEEKQRVMYALSSMEEFFSMTLTDPAVRDLAIKIELPKPLQEKGSRTIWDIIKQFMLSHFKVPKDMYTVFEEMVEVTQGIAGLDENFGSYSGSVDDYSESKQEIKKGEVAKEKGMSFRDKTGKWVKEQYYDKIRSATDALGDIHKDLKGAFKRYVSEVHTTSARRMKPLGSLEDQRKKLGVTERKLYDLALLNYHDAEARNDLAKIHKDNPELEKAFNEFESVIKEMSDQAIKYGLISKTRKYYLPNSVKDLQGLMAVLHGKGKGTLLAEVVADLGPKATEEQIIAAMSDALSRGAYPAMLKKPGATRKKTIWDIGNEIKDFYHDPIEAYATHIQRMTQSIEQHRMVGKSNRANLEEQVEKLVEKTKAKRTVAEDDKLASLQAQIAGLDKEISESLGTWFAKKGLNKEISETDQQQARNIIEAKFNEKFVTPGMAKFKAFSTAIALSQVTSMMIQVVDSWHLMAKFGSKNFMGSIFERNKMFTADDVDAHATLQEIVEGGWTQKMLEWSLKLTGFSTLDKFIKGVGMEAAIRKGSKLGIDEFRKEHGATYFREGEIEQLHKDLRNRVKTPLTLQFALNQLSEVQPITSAEMPKASIEGGNWAALAYMLKSYNVKQINNIHNRVAEAHTDGITLPGGKKIKGKGAALLVGALQVAILASAGASVDCMRNLVTGKDCAMGEEVVDNVLKIALASRYDADNVLKGRISQTFGGIVAPPLNLPEGILKDISTFLTDGEASWETFKNFPVVGRVIWGNYSQSSRKRLADTRRKRIYAMNKDIRTKSGVTGKDRKVLREAVKEYNKDATELGLKGITSDSLRRSHQRFKRSEARKKQADKRGGLVSAIEGAAGFLAPGEAVAAEIPEARRDFIGELALQENDKLIDKKGPIFPNDPPEDAPTGQKDIGFGHKITNAEKRSGQIYGINFKKGISLEEAYQILDADAKSHRSKARNKIGQVMFDKMDEKAQDILTDYSFTGTLNEFPNFFTAMKTRSYDDAVAEYERKYTKGGEKKLMTARNLFIKKKLDELKKQGYLI